MPRISSDKLAELLTVLTKSELRHISLSNQFSRNTKDKTYLIMFNLLVNQKLDNEKLYEKMEGLVKNRNHFNVIRHELYNKILKSMRSYPTSENDIDGTIIDGIKDILLLIDRGLSHQIEKVLLPIKQLAIKYEKYHYLLQLVLIESDIKLRNLSTDNLYSYIKNQEEFVYNNIIPKLNEYLDYEFMDLYTNCRLQLINYSDKSITNKIDDSLKSIYKRQKNLPVLVENKITKHNIDIFRYEDELINKSGVNITWNDLLIKQDLFIRTLLEEHYDIVVKSLPSRLISLYQNKLRLCFSASNEPLFESSIKELKALKFNNNRYEIAKMVQVFTYEQSYLRQMVKLTELKKSCNSVELFLEQNHRLIRRELYITLASMLIHSKFILEEYQTCIDLINNLITKYQKFNVRIDSISSNLLILLIAYYEIDQISSIKSRLPNIEKYIKEKEVLYNSSKSSLDFFKSLTNDKSNNIKQLKIFYDKLLIQKNDKKNNIIFTYFDLLNWVNSKLINKKYSMLLKKI